MRITTDIRPTLTDLQVLDFCKRGIHILPAVVPEQINRSVVEYANEVVLPLLEEQWFVEGVLLNEAAAGAVRSLPGRDFALPNIISDHRAEMPMPGGWHRDGNYVHDKKLNYVEVVYHPEDVPMEMWQRRTPSTVPGQRHLFRYNYWRTTSSSTAPPPSATA